MARYLIVRLSAMGDVAMLLPILYATARANPQHKFTFLTQPFLTSLLLNPPANLEVMAIDTKREERSLGGLMRYAERLRGERLDYFVDLHSVLRTRLLRICTTICCRTRSIALRKPRTERRRLLKQGASVGSTVPKMLKLYAETLRRSGLIVPEDIPPIDLGTMSPFLRETLEVHIPQRQSAQLRLGIAPFASTEAKTYDLHLMEQLIAKLSSQGRYQIYLFGGRDDGPILERWAQDYGATSLANKLGLHDELYAISMLDLMLSMDSANAHLAAMVGTPVLSIWCATHPDAGFMPLGQTLERCLQPAGLTCRPCSIFGKVARCTQGDMPCRRGLSPESIADKVDAFAHSINE